MYGGRMPATSKMVMKCQKVVILSYFTSLVVNALFNVTLLLFHLLYQGDIDICTTIGSISLLKIYMFVTVAKHGHPLLLVFMQKIVKMTDNDG